MRARTHTHTHTVYILKIHCMVIFCKAALVQYCNMKSALQINLIF